MAENTPKIVLVTPPRGFKSTTVQLLEAAGDTPP